MTDSIAFGGLTFRRRSDFVSRRLGGNNNPPSISALSYTQGDPIGGGQSIVFTGSGFTGTSAVTFGVAGNATYAVTNDNELTATLPALTFDDLPSFDGVAMALDNATALSTLLPSAGYFYWVLFRARAIDGSAVIANGYQNDAIFVDSGGYIGPQLRTSSGLHYVQAYHWTGIAGTGNEHEIYLNKWHCLLVRSDGVNVRSSLDGGAVSSIAAAGHTGGPGTLQIARNYLDGKFANIEIAEIGMIGSAQDDALFTSIVAGINQEYNINLGGVTPASLDRASLACTLLLKAGSYASTIWTGTASAGTSGGRNATADITTSPTVSNPTHPGEVSVVVTNSNGTSSTTFEYWDPRELAATTGFWEDFEGAPWVARGGSVGGSLTAPVAPPDVGAGAGTGFTSADTAPGGNTGKYLRSSGAGCFIEDYVTITTQSPGPGTTAWVLFKPNTAGADGGTAAPYLNRGLLSTNAGGYFIVSHTVNGFVCGYYDGTYDAVTAPCTLGTGVSGLAAWHMGVFVYNGTNMQASVDGSSLASASSLQGLPADTGNDTYRLQISTDYSSSVGFDGEILAAGTTKGTSTDAEVTKLRKWAQQRFGVTV